MGHLYIEFLIDSFKNYVDNGNEKIDIMYVRLAIEKEIKASDLLEDYEKTIYLNILYGIKERG